MTWKSIVLSDESIKHPALSNGSLNTRLESFNNPKFRLEFNGCCLKPDRATFTPMKIINFNNILLKNSNNILLQK